MLLVARLDTVLTRRLYINRNNHTHTEAKRAEIYRH
jgi:hypothetical protein